MRPDKTFFVRFRCTFHFTSDWISFVGSHLRFFVLLWRYLVFCMQTEWNPKKCCKLCQIIRCFEVVGNFVMHEYWVRNFVKLFCLILIGLSNFTYVIIFLRREESLWEGHRNLLEHSRISKRIVYHIFSEFKGWVCSWQFTRFEWTRYSNFPNILLTIKIHTVKSKIFTYR